MIDYLEELLEDEAVPMTVRRVVLGKARAENRAGEAEEKAEWRVAWPGELPVGAASSVDGSGGEEVLGADRVEETDARAEATGSADWSVGSAGIQAARGRWLYEALVRAGQAAQRVRDSGGTGVTVTLPGEGSRSMGLDVAALDRAVERDARRYDGGFPLY